MVDVKINRDQKWAILKTNKSMLEYKIVKDISGFIFFEFKVDKGTLPQELKGKYTSLDKAIEAFKAYERGMKQTQPAKRQEIAEEKEIRRAKLLTESS